MATILQKRDMMLKKINKEENIGPLNLWSGTLEARPFNLSDHVEETSLCQFIKFFKQGLVANKMRL